MTTAGETNTFISLRDAGNRQFKAGNYQKAKEFYTKAIETSKAPIAVIHSNRAQCNLYLKLFYDALNDCNIAIRLDPNIIKAYYRRAKALQELSRYRLALDDYKLVLSAIPDNEAVQKEIEKIEKLLKSDTRIDLKIYHKPEVYRSKKPLDTFSHHPSNYMSSNLYRSKAP